MKLDFYKPKNEILQNYIEGYYFISEDKKSEQIKYYTFPNNFHILSVNQNTEFLFPNNKVIIRSSSQDNIVINSVNKYSKPMEITYENPVNEITIYFKPLGINQFIDNPEIFKGPEISDFIPFIDFKENMKLVFIQPNRGNQIELLENYWLSKFSKKDLSTIVKMVSDIEADLRIEEIAEKHNFSRRYISKLFRKHVGKTPSEYRKIFRFRNSLNKVKDTKNLTHLSHSGLFYDQAHFIKDFKALTNINPSSFFKNIDIEKENVWLFI